MCDRCSTLIHIRAALINLYRDCQYFGWDRVSFLHRVVMCDAMFGIFNENSVIIHQCFSSFRAMLAESKGFLMLLISASHAVQCSSQLLPGSRKGKQHSSFLQVGKMKHRRQISHTHKTVAEQRIEQNCPKDPTLLLQDNFCPVKENQTQGQQMHL